MVRRDEVGTNNYDVENLEEMVSAFWDEEREMLEAFQAMLKSLTNLGDGVFVNTQKAIRNEQKGEEHIRSLPLNAVRSVFRKNRWITPRYSILRLIKRTGIMTVEQFSIRSIMFQSISSNSCFRSLVIGG